MSDQVSIANKQREYFPSLDGLRFLSILFVVLHHLDTFTGNFIKDNVSYPWVGEVGYFSIQFFFVGSGFLITYFLLTELDQTGSISLRKYFLRRILRIWPGYYLLLAMAFVAYLIFPLMSIPGVSENYYQDTLFSSSVLCFGFFLPHIPTFFSPSPPYIHQTYTIGIEEQFYLVWGMIFLFFRLHHKRLIFFLAISVALLELWHYSYHSLYGRPVSGTSLSYLSGAVTYMKYSRITTFAIGAFFAYAYIKKASWLRIYSMRSLQLYFYAFLMIIVVVGIRKLPWSDELISFVMISLFFFSARSSFRFLRFSQPFLVYLGKISYGIYLFHMFAIVLACKLVSIFFSASSFPVFLLLAFLSVGFSILFGWLSYHLVEKKFLNVKQKFYGGDSIEK